MSDELASQTPPQEQATQQESQSQNLIDTVAIDPMDALINDQLEQANLEVPLVDPVYDQNSMPEGQEQVPPANQQVQSFQDDNDLVQENVRLAQQLNQLQTWIQSQGLVPGQQQNGGQQPQALTADDYQNALQSPEGLQAFWTKAQTSVMEQALLRVNKAVAEQVQQTMTYKAVWETALKKNEDLAPFQELVVLEARNVATANPQGMPLDQLVAKSFENVRARLQRVLAQRGKANPVQTQNQPNQPVRTSFPGRNNGVRTPAPVQTDPSQQLIGAMLANMR